MKGSKFLDSAMLVGDKFSQEGNLKVLLLRAGVKVNEIHDGFLAIAELEKNPYQMVLIGDGVKVATAIEVASLIRYKFPRNQLKVILLLKNPDATLAKMARDCRPNALLAWPHTLDIVKTIKKLGFQLEGL